MKTFELFGYNDKRQRKASTRHHLLTVQAVKRGGLNLNLMKKLASILSSTTIKTINNILEEVMKMFLKKLTNFFGGVGGGAKYVLC